MQNNLICDSSPLNMCLKQKYPLIPKIRGADLMRQVILQSSTSNRHFFLGTTEQVLVALTTAAQNLNPNVCIAGYYSPPYVDDYEQLIQKWVDMIVDAKATVVWVGLGTPKQDYVVHEIASKLRVSVIAVGAAFDYLSRNKKECPVFIQKMSLEWLYRLLSEPLRLGPRYVLGNTKFTILMIKNFC
jgi:N-acetylglucosaminyldiphosphoundecaprenol N-acetyl-beta-D-mannosaminyltransferase